MGAGFDLGTPAGFRKKLQCLPFTRQCRRCMLILSGPQGEWGCCSGCRGGRGGAAAPAALRTRPLIPHPTHPTPSRPQLVAFAYLTWWELSWDVMEPIGGCS